MARAKAATDKTKQPKKPVEHEVLQGLDLDFSKSPVVWRFLNDDSFVRGLLGPVGSGKSYASAAEVILRAIRQVPSPIDNIRYTRFVIVRNSYPELRTTTIKTWQELFPENVWGPMRWSPDRLRSIVSGARSAKGCPQAAVFGIDRRMGERGQGAAEGCDRWIDPSRRAISYEVSRRADLARHLDGYKPD